MNVNVTHAPRPSVNVVHNNFQIVNVQHLVDSVTVIDYELQGVNQT